ncbi:uncharacterized protein LOC100511352 isoform X1 [Sus scrofa]|uniref:uncharacterized protein LOC100511352 isoform X1 n=1 Tax=Sus scrofa TaxID=9823 RepID=UPI000A2B665D|nr:uncharacterized protein LOC100511352 isoform X1 [Sus scrofa]
MSGFSPGRAGPPPCTSLSPGSLAVPRRVRRTAPVWFLVLQHRSRGFEHHFCQMVNLSPAAAAHHTQQARWDPITSCKGESPGSKDVAVPRGVHLLFPGLPAARVPWSGDTKRACRRLEVAQDGGCPQVKARPPESWGSREPESPDRGRLPAPRPDGGQGRPGVESLRIGGRSPAQPCPRCLAGESVGGSVPTQPPTDLPPAAGPCPRASDLTSASHGGHFNHTENR